MNCFLAADIDLGTAASVLSLVVSLISIGSVIYFAGVKIAKLEIKVDTMWNFQLRRAFSEAVDKGVATANSPLRFSDEARAFLDPLKDELIEYWSKTGHKLDDGSALLEIERLFGARLFEKVCIPCKLTHGACLILALGVARQKTEVDLTFY